MIPSWDQVGVPGLVGFTHFNSSTTSGSASWTRLRILLKVFARQSPSSAILSSISCDADWPWVEPDFFKFSSSRFSPPVALALDVFARSLAEIGSANDDDLEALGPGLVASPRTGRDAHRVPLLELNDLVVDLHH